MEIFNSFMTWWLDHHQNYEAVLFDVDGTLIAGTKPLPGNAAILDWLREHNFPFFLLTNDGNHSPQQKCARIGLGGINIAPEEIISCAHALVEAAIENKLIGKKVFVLGSLGDPCFAEAAGMQITRNVDEISECAAIIVGEGTYNWQKNMNATINQLILDPSVPLIVPNPDSYWPNGENGEIGIGAGGKTRFMTGILAEMGIEVTPQFLGKPYKAVFHHTLEVMSKRFKLNKNPHPEKVIMLGDSLASDIRGANNCGMTSALFLTGITTLAQAQKAHNEFRPDLIFKSLA
jgi:HAD superfamily hydrolase (TIGR01450 family)